MSWEFVRVRIGIAVMDHESGWHVVAQIGDDQAYVSCQSYTKAEALVQARAYAKSYEDTLTEAGVPWGR